MFQRITSPSISISILFIASFILVTTSLFFAFVTQPGVPPDETYHLTVAETFKNPLTFFLANSPSTYSVGDITRTPFLYHFIVGKLLNLNIFLPDFLFLRVLSVILGAVFLFFTHKLLKALTDNWRVHALTYFLLIQTTMLPFLFGSVTYDNPVNLLSLISIYILVLLYKKRRWSLIKPLVLIILIGPLVKKTFLPLTLVFTLAVLAIVYFHKKSFSVSKIKLRSPAWLVTVIVLVVINTYFYGINLIKYGRLLPACQQVLTHEQCLEHTGYKAGFEQILQPQSLTWSNATNFFNVWQHEMIQNSFGLLTHSAIVLSPGWLKLLTVFFAISWLLLLWTRGIKGSMLDRLLLLIVLAQFMILFIFNFSGYIHTGDYYGATQGRYLFPILVIFYYLIAKSWTQFLPKNQYAFIVMLMVLFYISNQNTLFAVLHQTAFHGDSYQRLPHLTENVRNLTYRFPRILTLIQ